MYEVGELIKWRNPLDEDYSYGTILDIRTNTATVMDSGYYAGIKRAVKLRNIRKVERGGDTRGDSDKPDK